MRHVHLTASFSLALSGLLIASLTSGSAVARTDTSGTSRVVAAQQPLAWHATNASTVRLVSTQKPQAQAQASAHRFRASRGTVGRLRSSVTTGRSTAFRVRVQPQRTHRIRVRVVRLTRTGPVVSRSATRLVKAGARHTFVLRTPRASVNTRAQVHVQVQGLRNRESVRVWGTSVVLRTHRPDIPGAPTDRPAPPLPNAPATPTAPTSRPTPPVSAGMLTNGCAYSTRGIPSCGAYLGMAYGSNSDPSALEKSWSGRLGVRRTYYTATQVDRAVSTARADLAAGRLPWISFKFPHGWAAMASGAGDAWARDIATKLAALDGPVWVAFHHEPENDGVITDWRAAQERLAPLVRAAAPNVAYTVVLTGWHQFYGPSEFSLANIWPRTTVDVAGFDIYNSGGVVKNGKTLKATDLDAAYFSKIQAWAQRQGVAWGLAETGFTDTAATTDPDWITRTHRQLEARGGAAFAYFNTPLNSIASWGLVTQAKTESYRRAQVGTPRLPLG